MNLLERGLKILEILAKNKAGLSFTEIEENLGKVNRSSLTNTLKELIRLGYIFKDENTGLYLLTDKINKLVSGNFSKKEFLITTYKKMMREISGKYNVTVILFERIGDCLVSIHKEKTESSITMQDVGDVNREIFSSPWMEVLSAMDKKIFNRLSAKHQKTLKSIAEQGFAYDDQKIYKNIRRLGFPIKDKEGNIIGALGIGGTTFQITEGNLNKIIKDIRKSLREEHA